ncbi:MAG: TetR/AcrR family transcriptional regulator [Proteobacteria bacterium]|nr:TetR/AcrR family transcriptional regulator [Pseudomonadota bacterium]
MSASVEVRPDSESPKRHAILDAAAELFLAHGYGAASMDAIAKAAGVSKATLYAHFASKDALFATIISDGCHAKMEAIELLALHPAESAEALRGLLATVGRRMMGFLLRPDTLAIYRIVVSEAARFPELGEAFHRNGPKSFLRFFSDWIEEQMRAGLLREADPEVAAEQYASMLRGSKFMRATLGLPVDVDEAAIGRHVDAVVDTFLRAYGPPCPAA